MRNSGAVITKASPEFCQRPTRKKKERPAAVIHGVHTRRENPKRSSGDLIINALVEIFRYISFLFSPEDSERGSLDRGKSGEGRFDLLGARPRVDIKAVFWIMASILIAIQLARFG